MASYLGNGILCGLFRSTNSPNSDRATTAIMHGRFPMPEAWIGTMQYLWCPFASWLLWNLCTADHAPSNDVSYLALHAQTTCHKTWLNWQATLTWYLNQRSFVSLNNVPMYALRDQWLVMGTGMDSFELCACSRWGTAYRKATGRGTAWKFKMPDYDSSVILKRMPCLLYTSDAADE